MTKNWEFPRFASQSQHACCFITIAQTSLYHIIPTLCSEIECAVHIPQSNDHEPLFLSLFCHKQINGRHLVQQRLPSNLILVTNCIRGLKDIIIPNYYYTIVLLGVSKRTIICVCVWLTF